MSCVLSVCNSTSRRWLPAPQIPSQSAQRLAESADYLGQVIQGLMGTSPSLGLPRLTGAEGEKRLKTLDSLYTDLNAAVRRAVAAAPALPAAQTAARAVTTDARALAAEGLSAAACGGYQ